MDLANGLTVIETRDKGDKISHYTISTPSSFVVLTESQFRDMIARYAKIIFKPHMEVQK